MSEEDKKSTENNFKDLTPDNLDDALSSLLGDLEKEPVQIPNSLPLPSLEVSPALSAQVDSALEPIVSAPAAPEPTESSTQEVKEGDANGFEPPVFVATAESDNEQVNSEKLTQGPFETTGKYRKPRRWPWILLLLLILLGGAGYAGYSLRALWLEKALLRLGLAKPKANEQAAADLPPSLALPPMDAPFLPTEEPNADSSGTPGAKPGTEKRSAGNAAAQPQKAPITAQPMVKPVAKATPSATAAAQPAEKIVAKPLPPAPVKVVLIPSAKPVAQVQNYPQAMDSAELRDVKGSLQGKVQFHCKIVFYSAEGGLARKLPPFDEALRVVIGNIFYFSAPGKASLPEIEQQVLQKAGFLFPEGKLVRVQVRDLELEPVQR